MGLEQYEDIVTSVIDGNKAVNIPNYLALINYLTAVEGFRLTDLVVEAGIVKMMFVNKRLKISLSLIGEGQYCSLERNF